MKKLIFMFAACIAVMSCTGNKTINNSNIVDTTNVDTTSAEDTICDSLLFQE